MTLEELKAEAKKMGYKLVKDSPYERWNACTCGHNRRTLWTTPNGYRYVCNKCGRSVEGRTQREAKKNWNKKGDKWFVGAEDASEMKEENG